VGRYLGTGVGWFSVLLTGAFGNIVNAFLQAPDHRSIGASTAVFAALGILSAFTWRRGFFRGTPWRTRFAPVTAGIALLAFTGTAGENTDLGAHLFGFVAGFAAGAALAGIALPRGVRIQAAFGGVSIGVFVAGWAAALYA
jgi:rhomboid protease GluP